MIFYTCIRTEQTRIFVIISSLLNEFLDVVASHYLRAVSLDAVFSTQP